MFEVHLTYGCNLDCAYCNRGVGLTAAKHTPDMTLEKYKEWLAELPGVIKRKRHLKILFTGGEPTLVPNLEDYMKATLEVAPFARFGIATNEYTQASRDKLKYFFDKYGVLNSGSAKPEGQPMYEFTKGMFLSPLDTGAPRKGGDGKHFPNTEPCPWSVRCGISVDSLGMTSCAMGGAVDGILDLGLRTKKFHELSDARLRELCKHCGAWTDPADVSEEKTVLWRGQRVSREWHAALMRLEPYGKDALPFAELKRREGAATISFIVPTVGRSTLAATVASIKRLPGDELLVIQHEKPSGNWGNDERQEGQDRASCEYVAFLDDDDIYVSDHRKIMAAAISANPGKPVVFQIQYPDGRTLPRPSNILGRPPMIKNGNVSSQMFLFPNDKKMLSRWDGHHRWADFHYIARSGWGHRANFVWRDEIIALLGHEDLYRYTTYRGRPRTETLP